MSSKECSVVLWGGMSAAVGVGLYVLLQLLFAVLVVNGVVAEKNVVVLQVAGGVLAGGCAGLASARFAKWGMAAMPVAVCAALCVVLAGYVVYGGIVLEGATLLRVLGIMVGGVIADLLAGKWGRKGKTRRVRKV